MSQSELQTESAATNTVETPTSTQAPIDDSHETWWTRTCGGRDVVSIALPLVVSMISWSVMNLVDRMLLLWYDADACAAALPAGAMMFSLVCFPLGVAAYANTFVAQYVGADRSRSVGRAVWQAALWAFAVTPLFLLAIPLAPWLFRLANHPPNVTQLEISYFQTLTLGVGGTILASSLSSFYSGRGQTRVVMRVDCLAALANVVLDIVFIFGLGPVPELGIVGAAIATNLCQWGRAGAYWWLMLSEDESTYGLRAGRRWDRALMGRMIYFGAPDGFRMAIEMGALTGFVFLVGRLGENAMASTTIAFNINGVGFMPLLGLSTAVATLVGQQLGAGRPALASRATWTALILGIGYTLVTAVFYLGLPDLILAGHQVGADEAEFAALRDTTVVLLRFVAAYCIVDAFYMVLVGTIKGAGDTRFVLLATIAISPIPVVVVWLGQRYADWGLYACWAVLTGWVFANGIIFALRVWQGKWRDMRVIEPQ